MLTKPTSRNIEIAAEAITAAQFSRCGFDISVQYGPNQPEYDLIAVKDETILKISVKGSQDGGWGLTQSFIKNADYHGAIEAWLQKHKPNTIYSLVQFYGVDLNQLPRIYLARPSEIAERLHETSNGRGDTILWEEKTWSRGNAFGTTEKIPELWRFSYERIQELLNLKSQVVCNI